MQQSLSLSSVLRLLTRIAPALICTTHLLSSATVQAAAIVNDTFDIAPATAGDDATDPLDVSWTGSNAITSVASDTGTPGLGSGNALAVGPFGSGASTFATFNRASLVNVGDSIQLSFDFRFTTPPAANASGFRFSLGNPFPDANAGAYDFTVGTGGTPGGAFLYRRSSFFAGGTPLVTAGLAGTISDTSEHNVSLRVTRSATGVLLSASVDGSTYTSSDTATTAVFSFNRIEIGEGAIQQSLRIDNVVVDVIPEPGAGMFLLTSAAGLLGFRRARLRSQSLV